MRTILLDADIVAYKVSCRNQEDFDFGDTGSARIVDHEQALKDTDDIVESYCREIGAGRAIICLTDPKVNFRKELNPTYKHNRAKVERPELLEWVKGYLAQEYQSLIRPRLEADDIMGILSTCGDKFGMKGIERVMVSEDKDMRTVPGLIYNPNHPEVGIIENSELDANRFHMWQTIVGDPTDGYPGCPGIGPGGKYEEDEDGNVRLVEGARSRSLSFADDLLSARSKDLWDIVVEAYASKGFTEDDALLQARMAHILWATSYNFKTKKIKLWQPYWLD